MVVLHKIIKRMTKHFIDLSQGYGASYLKPTHGIRKVEYRESEIENRKNEKVLKMDQKNIQKIFAWEITIVIKIIQTFSQIKTIRQINVKQTFKSKLGKNL